MGNSPEICRRHYAALVPDTMSYEVEFARQGHNLSIGYEAGHERQDMARGHQSNNHRAS
jgi:hypothetical protein